MNSQQEVPEVLAAEKPPGTASLKQHLHTHDFDELAQGLSVWDAEFSQISRGPFLGDLDFWQAGGVQAPLMA